MSTASPLQCCDLLEPPTASFSAGPLYPDVITVTPKLSLTFCTTFSKSALALSRCSAPGVLSRPFLVAVWLFVNSASVKFVLNLIHLFINKCVYYFILPTALAHQSRFAILAEDEPVFRGLGDLIWTKVFGKVHAF